MAGWTRTPSGAVGAGFDDGQQPDGEAEPSGGLEVLARLTCRNTLPVDVAGHDFGPEGDIGQDGGLGGSIEPSTSAVGSRSAKPRLCASDSASW